ncbi:fibronectin type III domain-containing protein [Conexibacter woesei]|uniref:Fibronectin type-III domain-containing protein n=1 Tax=Conexibacter woesei (strain DSM 14684 / CCUG 47730 / CIP 108061 / JCM 11494 / NBRC 100937 / ID131577) TaxID=469383 RepID=D3EYY2_CONWI|nr:fibronectin type III domain-containing protein [Conexibacter woesei]ADB49856.1 hypothetical protein Cwoe_1428 [Conexibacter woesei DSM 14684]
MRTTSGARYIAAAIATAVAVLTFAAAAGAVSVNGFAYQALGPYSEVGEFYEKGLGLPHARAIVAYDSADSPATMASIHQWVQRMQSRGRQVLISFNHNNSAPPDPTTYGQRIRAFRDWMIDHGSAIPEFTAWNEPNHPAENDTTRVRLNPSAANQAPLAAQYWKRLNSLCQIAVNGQRCAAIAGDFSDPNPTLSGHISFFNRYVADYTAELSVGTDRATPSKWAIHPYSAIANKNFSVVESWINSNTGSADVWLTELGAKFCRENWGFENLAGTPGNAITAAAYQDDRARALKGSLAGLSSRVTRAYYYTLGAPAADPHKHCDIEPGWDTQLLGDQYGYGSAERPAFRALFPSAPTPQAPAVATTGASSVNTTTATLNGTVNPLGLTTTYRFEYGDTAAYGASTPDTSAGAGSSAINASANLTGLRPGTTYHYRLVASNVMGTSYGADQTFKTLAEPHVAFVDAEWGQDTITDWSLTLPAGWQQRFLFGSRVAAGTSPAAVTLNGTPYIAFVDADNGNTITVWKKDPIADWQRIFLGGPAVTAGTSPTAVVMDGEVRIFFADATLNDTLTEWRLSGGRWLEQGLYVDAMATGTRPSAVVSGDTLHLLYVSAAGSTMAAWRWTAASGWHHSRLYQDPVAAGTSPSAVLSKGTVHVFHVNARNNHTISDWTWDANGWVQHPLWGHRVAARSSPSAIVSTAGDPLVFFVDDENNNRETTAWVWAGTAGWQQAFLHGERVAAGTSPSAVMTDETPHVYYVNADRANSITDWSWTTTRGWQQTFLWGHRVAAGSSPAGW